MLEFAEFLTVDPASITAENIDGLREVDWSDEDIIDIVHITALFNYVVRVPDGLGVDLPAGQGRETLVDRLSFRATARPESYSNIAANTSFRYLGFASHRLQSDP